MSLYIDRDVATSFAGDVELDQKGDIKLADALETCRASANFALRTDFGDLPANPLFGSNLGSYIGATNVAATHREMENNINKVLTEQIFDVTDVSCAVVPFDLYEALCVVNLAGTFLVSGELKTVDESRMAYTFPYISAEPTPLTI